MIWKDILGFKGYYQVNQHGDVKSLARLSKRKHKSGTISYKLTKEQLMKPYKGTDGYLYYFLFRIKNGIKKHKHFAKHRLVAIYFIPNPLRKREVNHIDYNRTDNSISNLEWVTSSENIRHTVNGDRGSVCVPGEKNPASKLKEHEVLEIRIATGRHQDIADRYGVSRRTVGFIKKRERWKHLS